MPYYYCNLQIAFHIVSIASHHPGVIVTNNEYNHKDIEIHYFCDEDQVTAFLPKKWFFIHYVYKERPLFDRKTITGKQKQYRNFQKLMFVCLLLLLLLLLFFLFVLFCFCFVFFLLLFCFVLFCFFLLCFVFLNIIMLMLLAKYKFDRWFQFFKTKELSPKKKIGFPLKPDDVIVIKCAWMER